MRILLVCVSLRGGGTERIVSRVANWLATTHDVTILPLSPRQPFFPLENSVAVIQPELPAQYGVKGIRLLKQLKHLYTGCRRTSPDICFVFGEDIAAAATLVFRLAGVRTVWIFLRGTPLRSLRGRNRFLNPPTLKLAKRLFVQTEASRSALLKTYPAEKLVVWPNPLDIPEQFSPTSTRDPLIINVGSIGRLKNQTGLLRIFEQLAAPEPWQLMFVGDGPRRPELEAAAAASTRSSSISVAGERQDVASMLDQAAIFAFTSWSEGFPNALAEAMAAGCACISYDCPTGPAELIEHGVNGFLVEPADEAEYARLLQRLIDEPELRAEFSKNARESMKRFEASVVMAQLEKMIEEVTEEVQGVRRKAQGKP